MGDEFLRLEHSVRHTYEAFIQMGRWLVFSDFLAVPYLSGGIDYVNDNGWKPGQPVPTVIRRTGPGRIILGILIKNPVSALRTNDASLYILGSYRAVKVRLHHNRIESRL